MNLLIRIMSSNPITYRIMQMWFSLSLYTQLMFGSAIMLVSVGSAAAFWNIAQQEKQMLLMSVQEVNAVMQLATTGIEKYPNITEEIIRQVLSPLGQEALIDSIALGKENEPYHVLITNEYATETSKYHPLIQLLSFVHILDTGHFDPWLHMPIKIPNSDYDELLVKVNYNYLETGLAQLFIDNSMQAWFSILTEFLMIFFLLYLPAQSFKRAISFAEHIHEGNGLVIPANGGAKETTELTVALNASSVKFKEQQDKIIAINQGLEQKIRETDVLLESTPDAIVVMDSQGIVLRVNSEAEQLFADNRNHLIGSSIINYIMPDMIDEWMCQLDPTHNPTAQPHLLRHQAKEFVIVNRLAEHITASVSFNSIPQANNQQTSNALIICSMRDVTFEKEAQQAIGRALEKAQEADRVKTQFLTAMSHEMRTPMNGVLGMAELLSMTGLSQEQQQYLNTILSTGTSLLTIINDILDYSQLAGGKASLHHQTIPLDDLLHMLKDFMCSSATEKKLTLEVSQTLGAVSIETDIGRLRQVLLHLLGNAIKFTHSGRVALTVSPIKVDVDGNRMDGLCFEVRDTGKGIEPHQLNRIFDSFTQADGSTTRQHDGMGIGLAICKQTAELLKGHLEVSSVVNEGSVFKFIIPAIIKTIAQQSNSNEQIKQGQIQLIGNVLLVEDNLINQKVAVALLKKLGLRVDVANDGQEAIDLWHQNTYDMIFMDCLMPNVDGFEATKRIRAEEQKNSNMRHIPISALTANALEDDKKRCADAGMDEFVSKPINSGVLTEIAKKYLRTSP